jgi:hypothetical protein
MRGLQFEIHFPQSTTTSYTIEVWNIVIELFLYICKFTNTVMPLQIKASHPELNWCWRSWMHMVFKKKDLTWIWYLSWNKLFKKILALHAPCGHLHFHNSNHCCKFNKTFCSSSFLPFNSYKIWCWIITS